MPRKSLARSSPPPSALTPDDVRTRLLAAAGVDETAQAALLRDAVAAVKDALVALHPLAPIPQADHYARLQAAKFIRDLVGAAPSKTSVGTNATQVIVNVDLPEWAMPKPVVIDSKPA